MTCSFTACFRTSSLVLPGLAAFTKEQQDEGDITVIWYWGVKG
jgi:hypothetical protein